MSHLKNPWLFVSILSIIIGIVFALAWLNTVEFMTYADVTTALTTTTATLGALLGIITAGLMFTQGKFSELESELTEKSPEYLTKTFSLDKIQTLKNHLLALRKTFIKLASATTIAKEKDLYERIITKTSLMIADFAVLLNLKLKQQGVPSISFEISEMDSTLHRIFEREKKTVKNEWQLFNIIKQITDTWEAPITYLTRRPSIDSGLQADLQKSVSILKLKEKVDKSSATVSNDVEQASDCVACEIQEISKKLRHDRIPQLFSQMQHASALRGKYFYLAFAFIAAPLLINLLLLPQLSQTTISYFQPIILATSLLSVLGVMFLLLYTQKILSV